MKPRPLGHTLKGLLDRAGRARQRHLCVLLCLAFAFLLPQQARSNVVLGGTRIIYPATEREVTLRLTNEGGNPALMQAWIDDGDLDSNPDAVDVPFVITPPLARINARMGQTLRIAYVPQNRVATDRESVFWLNVLDVPPLPSAQVANHMQLAFRSRIKLFFRPAGLAGNPGDAADNLQWRVVHTNKGVALQVRNDSAFHVSLTGVEIKPSSGRGVTVPARMLSPSSVTELGHGKLSGVVAGKATVVFDWINDYGATVRRESPLER